MRINAQPPFVGVRQANNDLPKAEPIVWRHASYRMSEPSSGYHSAYFPSAVTRRAGIKIGVCFELRRVSGKMAKQKIFLVVGPTPPIYLGSRTSAAGRDFFYEVPEPKQARVTGEQAFTATALSLAQVARVSLQTAFWLLQQTARPLAIPIYLPVLSLLNICLRLEFTRAAVRLKEIENVLYDFIFGPLKVYSERPVDADDEWASIDEQQRIAAFDRMQSEWRAREAERAEEMNRETEARKKEEQARASASPKALEFLQGPYAPMLFDTRKVSLLLAEVTEAKKSGVANVISVVGRHASINTGNSALIISLTDNVLVLQRDIQKVVQAGADASRRQLLAKKAVANQFVRLLFELPPNSASFAGAAKKSYRMLALAISSDKLRTESGPNLTAAQKRYADDLFRLLNLASELVEMA